MVKLNKRFQLWVCCGHGNWGCTEYDTIEECLLVSKYSEDFTITEKVEFEIKRINNK